MPKISAFLSFFLFNLLEIGVIVSFRWIRQTIDKKINKDKPWPARWNFKATSCASFYMNEFNVHSGYECIDHWRKNYITRWRGMCIFLQCCRLHIPQEPPKKAFYCSKKNISKSLFPKTSCGNTPFLKKASKQLL